MNEMMKTLMIIVLIMACHSGAFVAIYFGRVSRVEVCRSDLVLFVIPFAAAAAACAVALTQLIKTPSAETRWFLILAASLGCAAVSTVIGMTIAFNQWGTRMGPTAAGRVRLAPLLRGVGR